MASAHPPVRYQQGRQTLEAPCLKLGNLVKEFKIESTTYHLAPKMVYIYIYFYTWDNMGLMMGIAMNVP